jgi:hypothetical protein
LLPVIAHGLGDAGDLGVPLPLLLLATAGAVLVTAARLSNRTARGYGRVPAAGRRLPPLLVDAGRHPAAPGLAGALGALVLLLILVPAAAGPSDHVRNPAAWLLFGVFWPLLTILSILLGPVWRTVNPLRPLAGLLRGGSATAPLPEWVGVWPAAAMLAVFLWFDLVPLRRPLAVALLLAGYVLIVTFGAARFGNRWFSAADGFEVWSTALAPLSPLGAGEDGSPRLRSPRSALASAGAPPGLLALVVVVIGADVFDAVAATARWEQLTLGRAGVGALLVPSVGLAACTALVALLGWVATRRRPWLVPALVPLAAGYAVAHHLAPLLLDGQVALALLSDPLGLGWNLLGTADLALDVNLIPAAVAAAVQLLALVAGHVGAVVVAHDRTVLRFDPRTSRAVQFPPRVVIVGSALGAVALRFAP